WDRGLFVRGGDGRLLRAVGCVVDVTARKEAERIVRETALALTNAMPGIARIDLQGRYAEVNTDCALMLGCWPADLIGPDWESPVPPDDRGAARAAHRRMLAEGKAEFEARAVRGDGTEFHMYALLVRRTDARGETAGHYCFLRDVTERKRAEDA